MTVTAERRTENIKDVPSSVSTLSGEKLDVLSSGGEDVRLLSGRVPSLNIESSFGRAFPRFYIRGYGNPDFRAVASQPVSLVYDDVVQENPLLKGFPIFDLARVEVLAGPQGSLFGRNTPAGVVKFDSAAPEIGATDGYGSLSFGTYSTLNVEAAKSIPLGDAWAARAALLYQHRDNWVSNTYAPGPTQHTEGYDDRAARIQLLYQPARDFSALFNIHARDLDGAARVFRANIIQKGTNDLVAGFDPALFSTDGVNAQSIQSYGSSAAPALAGRRLRDLFHHRLRDRAHLQPRRRRRRLRRRVRAAVRPRPDPVLERDRRGAARPPPVHAGSAGRIALCRPAELAGRGLLLQRESFISDSYAYDSLNGGVQTSDLTDTQKSTSWAAFGSVKYDFTPQC